MEEKFVHSPEHVSFRSYKKTALGFLSLAALLLAAIAYISFAKATVVVTPRATDGEVEVTSEVRKEPAAGEVAGEVRSIILEGERTQEISGEENDIPAQAVGMVRIINDGAQGQQLIANTRLLSPEGILFRIKNRVAVPGRGSAVAEVYADKAGKEGEIAPTRFTIPGLTAELQKKVYAVSEVTMTGGTVKKVGVSQGDIDRATEEIAKQLLGPGTEELKKMWIPGVGNTEIYKTRIAEASASEPLGSEAKSVKVRAKIEIIGVRYDRDKLYSIVLAKLKERANGDEVLSQIDSDGFRVEIANADSETGIASVRGTLRGKFSLSEKSPILDPDQLVGLTKSSAETYLRGFHAVEDVKVKISPFWLNRLPNLKDRINIKVIVK